MIERKRKLSETQIEALCRLRRSGILREREGVTVATVGALKALGLVNVYPVFREIPNASTERVSRRAGWMLDITPAGMTIADAALYGRHPA